MANQARKQTATLQDETALTVGDCEIFKFMLGV